MKKLIGGLFVFIMLCVITPAFSSPPTLTPNKDVGYSCVNQTFTPATINVDIPVLEIGISNISEPTPIINQTLSLISDNQQNIYIESYHTDIALTITNINPYQSITTTHIVKDKTITTTQIVQDKTITTNQLNQGLFRVEIGKINPSVLNSKINPSVINSEIIPPVITTENRFTALFNEADNAFNSKYKFVPLL